MPFNLTFSRTLGLRAVVCASFSLLAVTSAYAHSARFDCQADGASHVVCTGGFSDGSDAAGVEVIVLSYEDKALVSGVLGAQSRFRFARPAQDFYVRMDAGEGHTAEIDHAEIR